MALAVNNRSNSDRNQTGVLRQLTALQKMSEPELREKWRDLYSSEPPCFKATFLKKRLAYRIQELFYGGLSGEARNKLSEIAVNDPAANILRDERAGVVRCIRNGKILPGTRLLREWNGKGYEVIAQEKGFEYDGKIFRSLTAIANRITGVKWNGLVFFGLRKR